MGMIQTFKQAWRIPEMRRKLIFTLIVMVIFRLGSNIPVPGVDHTVLEQMFNANDAGLFGLFDMFTGGSFSQFTIFALGIGPYITASIVLQLLTVAIPALEELAKQGEEKTFAHLRAIPNESAYGHRPILMQPELFAKSTVKNAESAGK